MKPVAASLSGHSIRALVLALACALGAPLAGAADAPPVAALADRIVAVVNNDVITSRELNQRVRQAVSQLQRRGTPLPARDVLERQLLEQLILERVQLQFATETSVQVDDAMLERAVQRIAENNNLSVSAFRAALAKDGLEWNDFRDSIRKEILLSRLREREVDSRVVVTEAEVDNFLATNPEALANEELHLSHILLRAPDGANAAQLSQLQEKAEGLLQRLRAGEDFGKLAASYSGAPDALAGGDIGWRRPDRLPPLYVEAAKALKPGELSPVLRSAAGFHVLKLVERRGGSAAAAAQVMQTHARHILIKTSEILGDAEAERRLQGLRERLVNKAATFDALARAHSADPSAAKGGDLGWLYPGDTVPEFERAMNALTPGEISQPVKSPFGWHLIQVDERRQRDVSDERKRAQVRQALRERKADEAYQEWVRQLRDRAYVDNRLDQP